MVRKINIQNLKKRLPKKVTILIDVMAEEIHQQVHIEGAINIPFEKLDHDACRELDPGAVIITYSIDWDCPVGRLAAEKLGEAGFRRVFFYQGGLTEWIESNLPVTRSATSAAG